ncbi:[protein-PII] uridylyltransferase [Desulfocurvus sp. DL9XJH121]
MGQEGSKAAQILARERDALAAQAAAVPGDEFCRRLSGIFDQYFRDRLREIWPREEGAPEESPFAVVAVGGYGRRELCLRSDVDILLVYERRIPARALDLAQSLFFPLWDLGCDLGHGFRSIKENLSLARKDFRVLACLLDARLVDGNPAVFKTLEESFRIKVVAKKKAPFTKWLQDASRERLERFGDASSLLEADLKRGIGGLRDYHQILWLGKAHYGASGPDELLRAGCLTEAQAHVLKDNVRFLLQVRTLLHAEAGRRNDRLHLSHQRAIAEALGFEDQGGSMAVERFLARLHREMAGLKALHASFVDGICEDRGGPSCGPDEDLSPGVVRRGRGLAFDLPRGYPDDPMVLLDIFTCSAKTGLPLRWEARGFVSAHLHLVGGHLAASPEAASRFMGILASDRAAATLEQMLECGFLGAFVPEFGRVQDTVQFDTYHVHPVGWHTVEVLRRVAEPAQGGDRRFAALLADVEDTRPLLAGAFLHDVGKGLGGGHAEKGEVLARDILGRWGWDGDGLEEAAFLVREHLVLFETATRRDLNDESVVARCAGKIGSRRRLDLLMLLTWADAGGTGPGAWSAWTASLVWDLYGKILRMLRRGRLASADAVRAMDDTRQALRRAAQGGPLEQAVEDCLDQMPSRYLLSHQPENILRHVDMVLRLREAVDEARRTRPGGRGGAGVVVVESREAPESGAHEITVASMDDARLFSTVAGVLALHGINIVSAECFLWREGTRVDVFMVSDLPGHLPPGVFEARVAAGVRNAMSGRLSLTYRLSEKRRSPLVRRSLDNAPEVMVHNEASDFYSLIEITAPDRIGLVCDIAKAVLNLGLRIQLAKIATYGDQVADVFYVREEEGGKISGADRVREVREALEHCLAQS